MPTPDEPGARTSLDQGLRLLLPVLVVIGATLGYPIYNLIRLSLQKYDLFALLQHHGTNVGLRNYSSVLHDSIFWHTLVRTIVFTVVNVGLTLALGGDDGRITVVDLDE